MFRSKLRAVCALVFVGAVASAASASSAFGGAAGKASASSTAQGALVIYGNAPTPQMQPVLAAFAKARPAIHIAYSDLDDPVAFSRYRAESAEHAHTADIIIASSPALWVQNQSIAYNWTPRGHKLYPSWRIQFPGVFILSPDPAVSIYSKAALTSPQDIPTTYAQLAADVKSNPGVFSHKLVTYSANNPYGYAAFWGLVQKEGWSALNVLGSQSTVTSDGTAMAMQVLTGAANYGYLESGLVRAALTPAEQKVMGWTYMRDMTPLIPRGIAVTKSARNKPAAEAFVNWLFSAQGQQVLCAAGYTAYRHGVSCPDSLGSVTQTIGIKHVFLVPFNTAIAHDHAAFLQRWQKLYNG